MRETKKITKQDINKAFTELRQHGWQVYGFNDRRHGTGGAKGFPDYVIMNDVFIYFIEVKLYKDNLSPEQYNFLKIEFTNLANHIFIVNEWSYTKIVDFILNREYELCVELTNIKEFYLLDYEKRIAKKEKKNEG